METLCLSKEEMEDEEIKMIPTRGRTKTPRALSFVASAKTFSLAFQDVPQFDLLRLHFWCYRVADALRPATRPREILLLHLGRPYRFLPSEEELEFVWDVHVGVCLRDDAHEVREWLQATGLNLASEWLLRNAGTQGELNRPSWRAYLDEDSREFIIEHKE